MMYDCLDEELISKIKYNSHLCKNKCLRLLPCNNLPLSD